MWRMTPSLAALALLGLDASTTLGADTEAALIGIATAPGRDGGVAWSVRSIRSLDGARVFLPGAGDVKAVAMAADGTVYAIRGHRRFGVAAPHSAAAWHDLPVTGRTKGLAVVADQVAWFAATATVDVLALTADGGRSWTVQKLPDDSAGDIDHGRLRLLAGGVLELTAAVYNCHSGDSSVRYRGRVGSNRWRLTWRGSEGDYRGPSHFGTADGDDDRPFTGADWFVRGEGQHVGYWIDPARKLGDGSDKPAQLVCSRDGETGKCVLSEQVPTGVQVITVDAKGRPLGVTKSDVWRWSAAKGWETLRVER